jgi:hypothetical protein
MEEPRSTGRGAISRASGLRERRKEIESSIKNFGFNVIILSGLSYSAAYSISFEVLLWQIHPIFGCRDLMKG